MWYEAGPETVWLAVRKERDGHVGSRNRRGGKASCFHSWWVVVEKLRQLRFVAGGAAAQALPPAAQPWPRLAMGLGLGLGLFVVIAAAGVWWVLARRPSFRKRPWSGKQLSFTTTSAAPDVLSVLSFPFSLAPLGFAESSCRALLRGLARQALSVYRRSFGVPSSLKGERWWPALVLQCSRANTSYRKAA